MNRMIRSWKFLQYITRTAWPKDSVYLMRGPGSKPLDRIAPIKANDLLTKCRKTLEHMTELILSPSQNKKPVLPRRRNAIYPLRIIPVNLSLVGNRIHLVTRVTCRINPIGQSRSYSTTSLPPEKIRKFIQENTEVSREHMTPEIALSLITPRCRLWSRPGDECEVPDPFWAFYWPGGQALTRYLLDNRELTLGKTVLDVGSGCGASSIAAALSGARAVTANDICPVAAEAMRINAELNQVEIDIITKNLIGQSNNVTWDLVLFGDMFYDDQFTDLVGEWIEYLHQENCTILIGDPGRVYLKKHKLRDRLELLYKAELLPQSKEENYGMTHGFVWKYGKVL